MYPITAGWAVKGGKAVGKNLKVKEKLRKIIKTIFIQHSSEMVFCYKNCFDLLWEKIVLVIKKSWRPRIFKNFEITRTIYSSSERSEQFLVTDWFLTCSWRVLRSNIIRIKIGKKILRFRNMQEKLENVIYVLVHTYLQCTLSTAVSVHNLCSIIHRH